MRAHTRRNLMLGLGIIGVIIVVAVVIIVIRTVL
jgi:hypothetical protein